MIHAIQPKQLYLYSPRDTLYVLVHPQRLSVIITYTGPDSSLEQEALILPCSSEQDIGQNPYWM